MSNKVSYDFNNIRSENRVEPWTMNTIGEVVDSMNRIMEHGDYDLDTPIIWNHLNNHTLVGQEVESHIYMD